MEKIMVIGGGQMGAGIAQVAAQAGCSVIINDISIEQAKKGITGIETILNRDVQKGKKTAEEKEAILARLSCGQLDEADSCGLVIEAASENLNVKKDIFTRLDSICRPEVIFATNTSSLPITELAAFTKRADRFIGMHFMNPVPVMKLVEIIRGLETSDATYQIIQDLSVEFGKNPVEINDSPGFVSNRVLIPMINEAVYCLYESLGTPEAIDTVLKLGMNHPMGPLALADLIGLDTCLSIMEVLYDGFRDSKYRPCPLLRQYVKAGRLGKKVGRGFYCYDA